MHGRRRPFAVLLLLVAGLAAATALSRSGLVFAYRPPGRDTRPAVGGVPTDGGTGAPDSAAAGRNEAMPGRGIAPCQAIHVVPGGMTPRPASRASGPAAGLVRFHVYDEDGRRLGWKAFRAVQENGKGADGDNDMLLDPVTLTVTSAWPLYEDGGDPVLHRPAGPAALSLAWPTADGYSALILDLPAPGTYVFTVLAARQAVGDLGDQLAARPGYRPSAEFTTSWRAARAELAMAESAGQEAERGRHGARAYGAAAHAQLLLLREFGVQYAARGTSGGRTPGTPTAGVSVPGGSAAPRPVTGFTFDAVPSGDADLARVSALVRGRPGEAAVRLVFDLAEGPAAYAATVRSAHARGIRVLGQILDSSEMAAVPLIQWRQRVARYVSVLPDVDAWEVGNEVNGNWLGPAVADKVSYATSYVKRHTHASTVLTLYWQLGEDDAAHSVFTWAARLPKSTLRGIDEIGLSVYPEEHPLGVAFDRVFRTLHATFPQQRLAVTELGYWDSDHHHRWWWASASDPVGTARPAVADLYSRAVLGYPYSAGGTYWWYFLDQVRARGPLYETFAAVRRDVLRQAGRNTCA